MAKGRKTGGRQKGSPNKATRDVREAFASLLERNAPKFDGWLNEVGAEDPARALDIVAKLAEYHVPKLQRTEVTGLNGKPIVVQSIENDDRI